MAENRRSTSSRVSIWFWIALGALLLAVGALIGGALATANPSNVSAWLREFVMRNGTGLFAVLAAVIAFLGINRQVSMSRKSEQSKAWWQTFEWAAERAIPTKPDGVALPAGIIVETLNQLVADATNPSQKSACGAIVTLLTPGEEAEESTPSPSGSDSESDYKRLVQALTTYSETSHGTPAESRRAEAYLYSQKVRSLLHEAVGQGALQAVTWEPRNNRGADAIAVARDGSQIHFIVKNYDTTARALKNLPAFLNRIEDIHSPGVSTIVIAPELAGYNSGLLTVPNIHLIQWRGTEDTPRFIQALLNISDRAK